MNQQSKISLLLVDDHRLFRQAMEVLLNLDEDFEVVNSVGSGAEAIEAYREYEPDVTLLDLSMPGMNGFEALSAIREINPEAKALILSTFEGEEDLRTAIKAGAKGFMLKDSDQEELSKAVKAVHEGEFIIPPRLSSKAAMYEFAEHLTPREKAVLELTASGLKNREIGDKLNIAESTVKIHLNNTFKKLNARNRMEAIQVAVSKGIIRK